MALLVLTSGIACKMQEEPVAKKEPEVAATPRPVRFVKAPPEEVAKTVQQAVASARSDRRDVVVYVGATWCEPCQRFHAAAERGELDAAFPGLTLVEYDADRDAERLAADGYSSQFIPLFVVPNADGTASTRRFEGSIKGPTAVADITPKLRKILQK
jgi:thiol-disulfide isomerase/thioredoxin